MQMLLGKTKMYAIHGGNIKEFNLSKNLSKNSMARDQS